MTLIEALAQKMRDAGVTAYVLNSPDEKNTTVTVSPYMGEVVSVDQAVVGDIQRIQYYARGAPRNYPDAEAMIWKAYREVLRLQDSAESIEGYVSLQPMQAPSYVGIDDKDRHMFTFNVPYQRTGSP